MAGTGETRAKQVTSQIDELLAAVVRGREEKKRLASEVRSAKRRKALLTNLARLLTTEDPLTVVALCERDRAARGNALEADSVRDELVAPELAANEAEAGDAAEAGGAASPELQDAERASATSNEDVQKE